VEAMRAEMLGLAAYKADPNPAAKELAIKRADSRVEARFVGGVVGVYLCKSSSAQIEGVLHQTANNTAEIKRLEGSVQHISHGARAAEVISKPGREELEQALSRAKDSKLDAESKLRIVNSTLDALAAEVRSRASLDRVACMGGWV
ncbi:MAG: hypothetical protein SGPRY_006754, partial [Prymnesium sp.]